MASLKEGPGTEDAYQRRKAKNSIKRYKKEFLQHRRRRDEQPETDDRFNAENPHRPSTVHGAWTW